MSTNSTSNDVVDWKKQHKKEKNNKKFVRNVQIRNDASKFNSLSIEEADFEALVEALAQARHSIEKSSNMQELQDIVMMVENRFDLKSCSISFNSDTDKIEWSIPKSHKDVKFVFLLIYFFVLFGSY